MRGAAEREMCTGRLLTAVASGYADVVIRSEEDRHGQGSRSISEERQTVRGPAQEGHEQGPRGRDRQHPGCVEQGRQAVWQWRRQQSEQAQQRSRKRRESRPEGGGRPQGRQEKLVSDVATLAVKGVAGGALVVAFALVSETLEPKRFAGLFSAAPAVALAGMAVVLLTKGSLAARENAIGMIAGGVGLVAYAAAVVPLLRRTKAPRASLLAMPIWVVTASVCAWPLL